MVYDCDMVCVSSSITSGWVGDGICDDGDGYTNLDCAEFDFDGGDCDSSGGGSGSTDPGDTCGEGQVFDCELTCVDEATATGYLGDGFCDDGSWDMVLDCAEFDFDGGDCEDGSSEEPEPGDSCGADQVYDCSMTCGPSRPRLDGSATASATTVHGAMTSPAMRSTSTAVTARKTWLPVSATPAAKDKIRLLHDLRRRRHGDVTAAMTSTTTAPGATTSTVHPLTSTMATAPAQSLRQETSALRARSTIAT